MKIINKIIPFLFFLLILIPIFSLAQPGQELGTMQLIYPKIEYIPQNENTNLHVHAFDELGNLLTPNNYDCNIHVYNSKNQHLIEDVMGDDGNNQEKEYMLNSSTVTGEVGFYSYNIWCYNVDEAGAISESFFVTRDGKDLRLVGDYDYFIIIFILCFICIVSLYISTLFSTDFLLLKIIFFLWGVLQVLLVLPIFLLTISDYSSPSAMFEWFIVYFTIDIFLLITFLITYWMKVGWTMIIKFTKMAKKKKAKKEKYL